MTGIPVPGVCEKCHILFPSGIAVRGKGTTVVGCTAGCPRCGTQSPILDGIYSNIGDALEFILREKGRETLQGLADFLRNAQQAGLSRDDITAKIDETAPELSSLKDWLPKTRKELYLVLGLIVTVLTMLLSSVAARVSKDDVQGYIHRAVQQAYQAQTQTQTQAQNVIVNVNPERSVGRNSPCPCGSGRKFKKCCGEGK